MSIPFPCVVGSRPGSRCSWNPSLRSAPPHSPSCTGCLGHHHPSEEHRPCWGSVCQKSGVVLPFDSAWLLSDIFSHFGFATDMLFPVALFSSVFSFTLVAAVLCPTRSPLDVICFWRSLGNLTEPPHW